MSHEGLEEKVSLLRRKHVLDALREERLTRRDIEERFDVARTTAYRTTVALEEHGLVESTASGYRLTPYGVAASAACERYDEILTAGERLQPLLELEDHPLFVSALHLFVDADVYTPDPDDPFWLIEWLMAQLAAADRYRCLVTTIGQSRQFEIAVERAQAGVDMEAVFPREGLESLDDEAARGVAESIRLPNSRAFVIEEVPFSLNTFDDTVIVAGNEDRTGLPAACAVTDRPETWDWAEATYRRYRRRADPVAPDELLP